MTLQFKEYTITGTKEEILDFIQAKEGITVSNGTNIQYVGKIMTDNLNDFCRDDITCAENIKKYKLLRGVVNQKDFEKHFDFYNQFVHERSNNGYYILYLDEEENEKIFEQERKWMGELNNDR